MTGKRPAIETSAPEASPKTDTRRRILDAAEALARCEGSGNLSLDAVAARAGVSKGGLLYHFPSKGRLMEALVEDYLGRFAAALSAEERTGQPDALLRAYITQFRTECRAKKKPASGLLAALAEDPAMLGPVRRHEADFLARIRNNASDPQMATLVFLAINGLRAMDLLNTQVLPPDEAETLLDWLGKRLES